MAFPPNRYPAPAGSKHPYVGPNYSKYGGEVEGFVYNPLDDQYYGYQRAIQMGLIKEEEPKAPGLIEQVAPVAVGAGALYAGKEIGQNFPSYIKKGSDFVGGLLGGGEKAAATTAETAGEGITGLIGSGEVVPVGSEVMADGSAGLLMSDGSIVAAPAGGLGLLPAAGIAGGLALGAKGAKDLLEGKETKGWEGWGGRATLGIATGGLSEVARLAGLGGHKSTKDYQDERWGSLSPGLQELRSASHPEDDDRVWDTGKYAGQEYTFDKALDLASEDPTHFIAVLGNLETFGDEWVSVPLDKQKEVVSRLIDEGLYTSDKGDILISDPNQAKNIFNEVMGSEEEGQIITT